MVNSFEPSLLVCSSWWSPRRVDANVSSVVVKGSARTSGRCLNALFVLGLVPFSVVVALHSRILSELCLALDIKLALHVAACRVCNHASAPAPRKHVAVPGLQATR